MDETERENGKCDVDEYNFVRKRKGEGVWRLKVLEIYMFIKTALK
jgi:hypothetical protein